MLKDSKAQRVRELLGVISQRKIARKLGIGRSSVSRIARGKWRPKRRERDASWPLEDEDAIKERCPKCHAMVIPPCVRCAIEAIPKDRRRARPDPAADKNFIVELRGRDNERYCALNAKRFVERWEKELRLLAKKIEDSETPAAEEIEPAEEIEKDLSVPVFESIDDLGEFEREIGDAAEGPR